MLNLNFAVNGLQLSDGPFSIKRCITGQGGLGRFFPSKAVGVCWWEISLGRAGRRIVRRLIINRLIVHRFFVGRLTVSTTKSTTAAGAGIGLALAKHYLDIGATVWGVSRREAEIEASRFHQVSCDLTRFGQVSSSLRKLLDGVTELDLVLLNGRNGASSGAATFYTGSVLDYICVPTAILEGCSLEVSGGGTTHVK